MSCPEEVEQRGILKLPLQQRENMRWKRHHHLDSTGDERECISARLSERQHLTGSMASCTASTWPLLPAQTLSYVGCGLEPPVNPAIVSSTPGTADRDLRSPQKQPPVRVYHLEQSKLRIGWLRNDPPASVAT